MESTMSSSEMQSDDLVQTTLEADEKPISAETKATVKNLNVKTFKENKELQNAKNPWLAKREEFRTRLSKKVRRVSLFLTEQSNFVDSSKPLRKMQSDELLDMMSSAYAKEMKVQDNPRVVMLLSATYKVLNEELMTKLRTTKRKLQKLEMSPSKKVKLDSGENRETGNAKKAEIDDDEDILGLDDFYISLKEVEIPFET